MVQAPPRPALLSLDDYLAMPHEPDRGPFEIERGVIKDMSPANELNRRIAMMLLLFFAGLGIPGNRITMKTEIVVQSNRVTAREPDLMVLSEELAIALERAPSSIITEDLPRPDLAVEVVSPGKVNRDRDYRYKRTEYAYCEIPEYWIVDPEEKRVLVLQWVDGAYNGVEFTGEMAIASPTFGALELRVDQVVTAQR